MAKVYVGTYAKHNAGSIKGAWLDLEDYSDAEEFISACLKLHSDEPDPELMFQDFEGFPREFYSESMIKPGLWEWLELSEDERNIWAAYQDGVNASGTAEDAKEAFSGIADTKQAFAEQLWDDCGMTEQVPEFARSYIDFEAVARDLDLSGDYSFVRYDGQLYVFHS